MTTFNISSQNAGSIENVGGDMVIHGAIRGAANEHIIELRDRRMSAGGGHATPSIFVSYRRTDAPGHAGRLYDGLVDRFGEAKVFKDLDSMEPGADFVEVIEETVARCDALIAVIGRGWLRAELGGRRRLDDPDDWVRLEIANALKRRIRVVPVLVERTPMPSAADLPEELRALVHRHAVELNETAWRAQVDQLIAALG
jgi:TIR domain-containing protein